jgi:hypothetical protein
LRACERQLTEQSLFFFFFFFFAGAELLCSTTQQRWVDVSHGVHFNLRGHAGGMA